jgi:hypothetical protein
MDARAEIETPPDCAMSEPYGGRKNVAILDRSGAFISVNYYYIDEMTGAWTGRPIVYGDYTLPIYHSLHQYVVHRVYWSPDDDLIIWETASIWLRMAAGIHRSTKPEFFYH